MYIYIYGDGSISPFPFAYVWDDHENSTNSWMISITDSSQVGINNNFNGCALNVTYNYTIDYLGVPISSGFRANTYFFNQACCDPFYS